MRRSFTDPSRIAAAAFAVLLTLLLSACASGRAGAVAPGSRGALAVVLAPTRTGTRLVVVDLADLRTLRSIPLRSLVTDIDLDDESGQVVAAQTGGIGDRADRAISITDPRTGRVRYVSLDVPDPVNVVCRDGLAYALHSVVTSGGLVCSIVDVRAGTLKRTGRAPDGPGIWAPSREGIWTVRAGEKEWAAVRLDVATLRVSAAPTSVVRVSGVAETATDTVLLGALKSDPKRSVVTFVPKCGRPERPVELPDLQYPARMAALAGEYLVTGDWAGQDPEPSELTVLDATTLRPQRTIRIPGSPCAFVASGSRILVVERTTGRLLEIDPASGATVRSLTLGTGELLVSDIVTVPEARAGAAR